jgi:hypothetical protein
MAKQISAGVLAKSVSIVLLHLAIGACAGAPAARQPPSSSAPANMLALPAANAKEPHAVQRVSLMLDHASGAEALRSMEGIASTPVLVRARACNSVSDLA